MRNPSQLQNAKPQTSVRLNQSINIPALFQQATHWHQQGDLNKAEQLYLQLVARKPHHFDALHHLCMIALQKKELSQALNWIDRALIENPLHALAHANRGIVLHHLQRYAEAVRSYDRAIRLHPQYAQAYCNRGIALRELGSVDLAISSYDQAIALKPDYAEAYANRGNAYLKLNALEQALQDASRAIQLKPKMAQYYCNRSVIWHAMQQFTESLQDVNYAIQLQPDNALAYWNRSNIYLLHGQFDLGWQDYEWRLLLEHYPATYFTAPRWRGTQSLQGKSILLYAEQGLGDTLQFCRYVPLVAELGAKVYLQVQPSLRALLQTLPGVHRWVDEGVDTSQMDYQCALMSLPMAFKTNLQSIPSPRHYLSSSHEYRQLWRKKLASSDRLRVGIVCSGSPSHANDNQRSIPLQILLDALPKNMQLISLQNNIRHSDSAALKAGRVKYFGQEIHDFRDTAALCDLVDVVLTVDTSVAHLAGAMGRPTCLLLPFCPDWRWLLHRTDSPWYHSIKIYRQKKQNCWHEILTELSQDLLSKLDHFSQQAS